MKLRAILLSGSVLLFAQFTPGVLAQSPPVINSFSVENGDVFLGGRGTFLYDVTGARSLQVDQGVGAVTGTSARFSQTGKYYLVPRGTTWKYLADGSDQGPSDLVDGSPGYDATNWKHPDFDDSLWLDGPGELGYGDNPDTDVGFVDADPVTAGDQKNATTYYRTEFDFTSAESSMLANLYLEIRRDDSAIVYLNGEEIARMNCGDGVLNFDSYTEDLGHSITGGTSETTYFVCELTGTAIPEVGQNTLAVEIHQANPTSSDTRFDLGLYQILTGGGTPVFGPGSTWSYRDNGANLGDAAIVAGDPAYDASNWKHPDFDDNGWSTGDGSFGFDVGVVTERTIVRFGPNDDNADNDPDNKFITTYFRSTFDVSAAELGVIATAGASVRADDGVIVYINGVEAFRDGVDVGEVTMDTPATPAVAVGGGVNETDYDVSAIDPAVFVAGENVIAVELHQSSATSSDVSFDMDLSIANAAAQALEKIARGSEWSYLDDGGASLNDSSSNIVAGDAAYDATNWKHPAFDDTGWRSGRGELGYGDTALTIGGHLPDVFTTGLGFGPDPANKFTTTYFRRQFEVDGTDLSNALGARISARGDDGLIVYVNGTEIWRSNMPANPDPEDPEGVPVDGTTFANAAIAGDGRTFSFVEFDTDLLTAGTNTIAVELHQTSLTSSDAAFDLGLELISRTNMVTYTLTAENEFGTDTATVTATTIEVPDLPIYLTNSNGSTLSWIMPEVWSDKLAPHAGDYIAYGEFDSVVRSPVNADDPVFGGTSLEIRGASSQLFLAHGSGTATFSSIILNGGRIVNGTGADLAVGGVGNSIEVSSDSTIGTNSGAGTLTVSANLTDSGGVRVRNPGGTTPAAAIFTGDNVGFSGDWTIQGIMVPASPTAFGSGAISVTDTGVLDPAIDFLELLPNPLSLAPLATINLDQVMAFVSGAVTVDGNVVPDGSYSATDLDALGFGGVFTDGGGTLFVGSVSPDSDGDGLLDSWELMFFPDLAATDGSGDEDGDGQSDAAEFAANTSPIDPADVLEITSVGQDPGSGDVTLTWPSKVGVTYGVRFGDLTTWNVIATGLAGTGGEMSFTDDGSLTGGAPADDDERHYQVFVE